MTVAFEFSRTVVTDENTGATEAGAYTRPLFSSTCAVHNSKHTLHTPSTPPKRTPYPIHKRLR